MKYIEKEHYGERKDKFPAFSELASVEYSISKLRSSEGCHEKFKVVHRKV